MERFNPFANPTGVEDDPDPLTTNFGSGIRNSREDVAASVSSINSRQTTAPTRTDSIGSGRYAAPSATMATRGQQQTPSGTITGSSRYSTSFPDPFGETLAGSGRVDQQQEGINMRGNNTPASNRSNSVTFAPSSLRHSAYESPTTLSREPRSARQTTGGLSSFLSRATSVTSSSVTDRVSGAVGSVKSAVDSLSSQIQQAVPASLNERLSSTATNLIGGSSGSNLASSANTSTQQQQTPIGAIASDHQASSLSSPLPSQPGQQQSAASYLASKISSATNQFTSSGQSSGSLPVISRQRVVLILDNSSATNWAQQFKNYRRLMSGGSSTTSSAQSALTSFFSSATAQLTSSSFSSLSPSSTATSGEVDGDLVVEQANFKDVSVLANQSSSTVTIRIANSNANYSSGSGSTQRLSLSLKDDPYSRRSTTTMASAHIVRPEYVIIKQRTKERLDHLRKIVTALNYCLVPMFEPIEVWNTFQDRQMIFARLLKVQKTLGKENFPLIPQLYCQTHLDLLNYLSNNPSASLPCLVRTSGPMGKGRIKIDNLQMLKDFASIVATSGSSCTIEQYLDVKCDLIVQRLGTSLKLFRRIISTNKNNQQQQQLQQNTASMTYTSELSGDNSGSFEFGETNARRSDQFGSRQQAARQTSIGSSVLSSLITSASGGQQQQQSQNPAASSNNFERLSEINVRYKSWVDAIVREFDNKLQTFCIKIVVARNDREYIVGLGDCSMDFMGNADNQEEDRRSFVELIISNMNTLLPKTSSLSRESSSGMTQASAANSVSRRNSSDDRPDRYQHQQQQSTGDQGDRQVVPGDKKRFTSQSQINGSPSNQTNHHHNVLNGSSQSSNSAVAAAASRGYGQLGNRSQSVSMNQSDYLLNDQATLNKSAYFNRRGSDRSDSGVMDGVGGQQQQQQSPFGSLFNQDGYSTQHSQLTNSNSSSLHQRQSSLGQSLLDQTSTAFSSLHKQSMSFFKRLDSRGGDIVSNTPPQSAKSDIGFDRGFPSTVCATGSGGGGSSAVSGARDEFMSQSVDSSLLGEGLASNRLSARRRETPPKPPPPRIMGNRQSSLASYSTQRPISAMSTPASTRQNSQTISDSGSHRGRVVRQNSALSAFEPFDSDLVAQFRSSSTDITADLPAGRPSAATTTTITPGSAGNQQFVDRQEGTASEVVKKGANFDSTSVTSGDSNSTGETATEDTMNNLKKTFASIFGDKCE